MSLNLLDDGLNMYLNHSATLGKFVVDKEPIEVNSFVVHPDLKTGYMKWTDDRKKIAQWDAKVGVKPDNWQDLVKEDYGRAFHARICVDNKSVYIWETSGKVNLATFDQMMTDAYAVPEHERQGLAPCFMYEGAERVTRGMWSGFEAKIKFVKWVQVPELFDLQNDVESNQVDNKDDSLDDGIPF